MGLFIDRIREITGLVKVSSRLFVTPRVVIPGIAAADAFDAGDALGTQGELVVPEYGIIASAKLIDPDDDVLVTTMHIFAKPLFSPQTSDNALAISADDSKNWVTSITCLPTTDVGAAKVCEVNSINVPYYAPSKKLYFQFSTAGTPTIAAGAMPLVQLYILQLIGNS